MICKWARDCQHCRVNIEVGDEIHIVTGLMGDREYICTWCAKLEGILCRCGAKKKTEHATCYACKRNQDRATGLVCECGKYKKAEYAMCWTCKHKER